MWPLATGQIQTSFHAGGITSAWMRSRVAVSVMRFPPASTYSKPFPRRRRWRPGPAQETRRRRVVATVGPSDLGLEVHRGLLGGVAAEVGADVGSDQIGLRVGARALVRLDEAPDALTGPLGVRRVSGRRLVGRLVDEVDDVRLLARDPAVERLAVVHLGCRRTELVSGQRGVVRRLHAVGVLDVAGAQVGGALEVRDAL